MKWMGGGREGGREGGRGRKSDFLSLSSFSLSSGHNDHFCLFKGTNNLEDLGEIPPWGAPEGKVPKCWYNCQVGREGGREGGCASPAVRK